MTGRATTLLALAFGLLFAALATRRGEVAGLALPVLGYLAAAVWRAPSSGELRLAARRHVERTPDGMVEVSLSVRNQGALSVPLRLEDAPHPAVRLAGGAAAARALLLAGEELELCYRFRARRGRYRWYAARATAADPLGLVEASLDLPAPAELLVHPELVRLKPLPLQPRRTLPSPGTIPARAGGSGTDFFGIRPYQAGDPLRWLDWRRAARHPGRLFTREFEQERTADVGLVLDCRGPAHPPGEEGLLEHAARATASLAETFLRQGHRVSLLLVGEGGSRVYPGYGRAQLQRILSCLAAARPVPVDPGLGLPTSLGRLLGARSLLVVLSPLLLDDAPALLRLRAQGRQVVLVSPDPIDAGGPAAAGRHGELALRAARIERRLGLGAVAALGIPAIDWPVDRPLYPLLRGALRPPRGPGGA